MKRLHIIAMILAITNLLLFVCCKSSGSSAKNKANQADTEMVCINGGVGAASCQISPGIKIGNDISVGCSVTCNEGSYACCGIGCYCIRNS